MCASNVSSQRVKVKARMHFLQVRWIYSRNINEMFECFYALLLKPPMVTSVLLVFLCACVWFGCVSVCFMYVCMWGVWKWDIYADELPSSMGVMQPLQHQVNNNSTVQSSISVFTLFKQTSSVFKCVMLFNHSQQSLENTQDFLFLHTSLICASCAQNNHFSQKHCAFWWWLTVKTSTKSPISLMFHQSWNVFIW